VGAMNSEINSKKWLFGGIALQFAVGFTVGYLVYQIGSIATTGSIGAGFFPGLIAVLVIAAIIVAIIMNNQKKFKAEYELKTQEKITLR